MFVNKMIYSMKAHQNTWGRVSQVWKWVWKWNDDILNFQYKWLIGVDAGGNADKLSAVRLCMCSGFPTKMMEQTIVMS